MKTRTKQQTASDRDLPQRSVSVLVSGFSRQSAVRIEEIASTIESVPDFHLTGLDEIIYDPDWETPSAYELQASNCPRKSKGVFLHDKRQILVFSFDDPDELEHILFHEIGHHVFDRVLESTLRKKWVTLINPDSRHVTRYATLDPLEDFAECYAMFMRNPKKLETIHTKYSFLRDHVFAGVAFNPKRGHIDISV